MAVIKVLCDGNCSECDMCIDLDFDEENEEHEFACWVMENNIEIVTLNEGS